MPRLPSGQTSGLSLSHIVSHLQQTHLHVLTHMLTHMRKKDKRPMAGIKNGHCVSIDPTQIDQSLGKKNPVQLQVDQEAELTQSKVSRSRKLRNLLVAVHVMNFSFSRNVVV